MKKSCVRVLYLHVDVVDHLLDVRDHRAPVEIGGCSAGLEEGGAQSLDLKSIILNIHGANPYRRKNRILYVSLLL